MNGTPQRMSEYVTLLGAEDVKSAAFIMREAAASIAASVDNLGYLMRQHEQEMERILAEPRPINPKESTDA